MIEYAREFNALDASISTLMESAKKRIEKCLAIKMIE